MKCQTRLQHQVVRHLGEQWRLPCCKTIYSFTNLAMQNLPIASSNEPYAWRK